MAHADAVSGEGAGDEQRAAALPGRDSAHMIATVAETPVAIGRSGRPGERWVAGHLRVAGLPVREQRGVPRTVERGVHSQTTPAAGRARSNKLLDRAYAAGEGG